jgi:hypothetical protein
MLVGVSALIKPVTVVPSLSSRIDAIKARLDR